MTSPVEAVTLSPSARRLALIRYIGTTALARSADAGAAIGLLLLCLERRDRVGDPILLGSVLAGAVIAPHLLGPVLARRIDGARDARKLLAASMIGYGVFLGAATVSVGRLPAVVAVLFTALAGVCGPLLTGGMSSQLAVITGDEREVRRRGEGWDAVTYGLSGTVGPALVSVVAAAASASVALIALVAAVFVAGLGVLTLPRARGAGEEPIEPLPTRTVLAAVGRVGALRRATYSTMIVSLTLGGLAVIAVQLGERLGFGSSTAASLMACFGLGSLVSSLVITWRPWRGNPDRILTGIIGAIAVALLVCAFAGSLPLAVVGYLLVGATQGPYIAAIMSVRSEYAPDGARAQVFVTMAALKVAAGAVGPPLVGLLSDVGPRRLLVAGAVLVALTAAAMVVDRRRQGRAAVGSPVS